MQLLATNIESVSTWLNQNPTWATVITFLVSFSESLAIVGSIIPGSVTMTAIGILVGTGVISAKATFAAAILGAIAGDSASYFLGYYYKDRIITMWPFRNYPTWYQHGKSYFEKHGGKSVLLGRFFGPLRSIIPLIAGTMQMPQTRFLIANILSAIGWSFLYILPGVFIGAASTELSADLASSLFIYLILFLLVIWLSGLFLKWFISLSNRYLQAHIENYWRYMGQHPRLKKTFIILFNRDDHQDTSQFKLLLFILLLLILYSTLTIAIYSSTIISEIDSAAMHFLISIQTLHFNHLFSFLLQLGKPSSLIFIFTTHLLYLVWRQHNKIALIWLINGISIFLLALGLNCYFNPITISSYLASFKFHFPNQSIVLSSNLIVLSALLFCRNNGKIQKDIIKSVCATTLILYCLAVLYFSYSLPTSILASLCLGCALALVSLLLINYFDKQWLFAPRYQILVSLSLLALMLVSNFYSSPMPKTVKIKRPSAKQTTISKWWNRQSNLPLNRHNRLGHRATPLNIQWLGNLSAIERQLINDNWKRADSSYLALLERIFSKNKMHQLPLFTQLFHNKKPDLVLIKHSNKSLPLLVLRLWKSPVQISDTNQPLWIGTLYYRSIHKKNKHNAFAQQQYTGNYSTKNQLKHALKANYEFKEIQFSTTEWKKNIGIKIIKLYLVKPVSNNPR